MSYEENNDGIVEETVPVEEGLILSDDIELLPPPEEECDWESHDKPDYDGAGAEGGE